MDLGPPHKHMNPQALAHTSMKIYKHWHTRPHCKYMSHTTQNQTEEEEREEKNYRSLCASF